MDSKLAFCILGIDFTKDLEEIRQAYRKNLVNTNPEDDPEGFKRLREAYEEACRYARIKEEPRQETEEKSPVLKWLDKVKEVYESLPKRISLDCWKELLQADVCTDLDLAEEVRDELFGYLMTNFRLLPEVWRLLNEYFLIEEEEQEYRELFPEDFIRYIISQIHSEVSFPYSLFQGDDRADYDTWIGDYFKLYDAVENQDTQLAESIIENMDTMDISHPLLDMEKARLMWLKGKKREAVVLAEALLKEYPDEIRLMVRGSDLLWEEGQSENAADLYKKILKIYPEHYISNLHLGQYYAKQKEYKTAKEYLGVVGRLNSQDENLQKCLFDVNVHMIADYEERIAAGEGDMDMYIDLGWCYLQNDEPLKGIEKLRDQIPDEAHGSAYHSIMERLYFSANMPDEAQKEGYAWIESIEREEPGLSEEEKERVPERKAASYYIMGRAWMQDEKHDEKALDCFQKALEYYKLNGDVYLQEAIIYNRMEQFQQAVDVCDALLELEPGNFWAYVYRLEAFFGMKNAQSVIDDFYRAREIFPGYAPVYERAAEVFEIYSQYEDVLHIVEQAEQANIMTNKLKVMYLRALNREAKNREDVETMLDKAERFLADLDDKEDRELKGEVYAEVARARGNISDTKAALAYINRAIGIQKKPLYLWLKGSFLMDLEEYDEALTVLLACEEHFPDGDRVTYRIGECYYNVGKPGKAAAYLEKTLKINPENNLANGKLAELYRELLMKNEEKDIYEKALGYANRQLELCPEAYYYIERGLLHMEAGAYLDAVRDFEKAAEKEPDNIYAYNNICASYRMLGKYEKAIEAGKKAEKLMKKESTARVYGNLGDCYMETGDYSRALEYYLLHQKQFQKGRSPMESLVKVNFRLNHLETAFYWIMEAYKGNEKAIALHKAEVYAWAGDGEKARLYLKDLLKENYEPYRVKYLMAQISYYLLERKRDALKFAKQVMSETKAGSSYYMDAGILMEEIYYRAGKIKKAKKIADELMKVWKEQYKEVESVMKTWKDRSSRLVELCQICFFAGEKEEAKKYLGLLCQSPKCDRCTCGKCSQIPYIQGLLAEEEKDYERAQVCYRLLGQREPENIQYRFAMNRLKTEI